jgi:hypothetical protein
VPVGVRLFDETFKLWQPYQQCVEKPSPNLPSESSYAAVQHFYISFWDFIFTCSLLSIPISSQLIKDTTSRQQVIWFTPWNSKRSLYEH